MGRSDECFTKWERGGTFEIPSLSEKAECLKGEKGMLLVRVRGGKNDELIINYVDDWKKNCASLPLSASEEITEAPQGLAMGPQRMNLIQYRCLFKEREDETHLRGGTISRLEKKKNDGGNSIV